jgi:uncharacterized protein YjbI with pentapeptide repeats
MIEIKHRYTGNVIFSSDTAKNDVAAVREAISNKIDLPYADLSKLHLVHVNFQGINLSHVNFAESNLNYANLSGCDLSHVDFDNASMYFTDLTGSYVSAARFTGSIMKYCLLDNCNIHDADFTDIQHDLYRVLGDARKEVPGILAALHDGHINGGDYAGKYCCLIGTIAKLQNTTFDNVPGIKSDPKSPIETWFGAIRPGNIPESNRIVSLTVQWINDWVANN